MTETPRRAEQDLIDAEVRASRRLMLARFRTRLRTAPQTLAAEDFLALTDRSTLLTAIVIASTDVADGCDLQIRDTGRHRPRVVRHRGLPLTFPGYLASADVATASACGVVWATGDPVLVDDIEHSAIFAGRPTLRMSLDAGFRAVHSYPLRDGHRRLLGVLSLHYRTAGRHRGQEHFAWAAAKALNSVATRPGSGADPQTVAGLCVAHADGVVTVTVRGPLDAVTAPDCAALVHRTITGLSAGQVMIIDLRGCDFLAVAGVRVLIDAARRSLDRQARCAVLITPGHDAVRILDRLDATDAVHLITDTATIPATERP